MTIHPVAPVSTDFARVIAPVSPQGFLDEYFEKRHLVIRRGDPGYFGALLTLADIDRVLTGMALTGEDMNMVQTGTRIEPEDYLTPAGFVDPVRAIQHFLGGATIILPGLHRRLPALAAYCRGLETVFNCELQTNIYFTPGGAQGFKTHYDSHDVFVLQTHGSKTWRIYQSELALPLRSQAFAPEGFAPGPVIDEFVLEAGDMVYIPRGVVHDARATDQMSLHVTTGLLTPRWIDLMVDALVDLAHRDPALRGAVPPGFANDGFDPAAAVATFGALMRRAVDGVDPLQALNAAAQQFRERRAPVVPGQLAQALEAGTIVPETAVQRRPDLIYGLGIIGEDDDAEVVLDVYGTEISFPGHVEPALRDAMTRGGVFRVADLAGDLDSEGAVVLVRRLVREGVLERVG